jgi:hypothetical protein
VDQESVHLAESSSETTVASRRQVVAGILLLVGAAIWVQLNRGNRGRFIWSWQQLWVMVLAGVCLIPRVAPAIGRVLDCARKPTPGARRWVTLGLTILAGAYLAFTARHQQRDLFFKIHDEGMYLLQARMLAEGHLWIPSHPLADFFESFHILVRPVYASIYFPGTAMVYAPAMLLHAQPWIVAVLIAAAAVGMTYRVTTELTDGLLGCLAALMLVSLTRFRHLSVMVMSHPLMLLLGLLMVWAHLRWRGGRRRPGWAVVIGAIAGMAAITRPMDALCYAVPIGVAMLIDLGVRPRAVLATAACLVAGAAPFLAVQGVMNYGVTGRVLHSAAEEYDQRYWPHLMLGSSAPIDANFRPPTSLQQVQDYYDQFMLKPAREQAGQPVSRVILSQRVPMVLSQTLPSLLLLILFPVGLLSLTDRPRAAFWAVLPLFLAGYSLFIFFQRHYTVVVAPVVIVTVLLGVRVLQGAFPRAERFLTAFLTLSIVMLSLCALPEWTGLRDDEGSPSLRDVNRKLAGISDVRAIVLFRYRSGDNFRHEPVYNVERAWPDDNRIIRAHDLGPGRDREIVEYYARRQPDRVFYLYDRRDATLTRLGSAAELAAGPGPVTP